MYISIKDVSKQLQYIVLLSSVLFLLQVVPHWNVLYKLALTDKNMQVRFCLKVALEFWDCIFLGNAASFCGPIGGISQKLVVTPKIYIISEFQNHLEQNLACVLLSVWANLKVTFQFGTPCISVVPVHQLLCFMLN